MISNLELNNTSKPKQTWEEFENILDCLRDTGKLSQCINIQDSILGKTALHIAAEKKLYECVRYLVLEGADPSINDKYGKEPADCTESNLIKQLLNDIKKIATVKPHREEDSPNTENFSEVKEGKEEIKPPKQKQSKEAIETKNDQQIRRLCQEFHVDVISTRERGNIEPYKPIGFIAVEKHEKAISEIKEKMERNKKEYQKADFEAGKIILELQSKISRLEAQLSVNTAQDPANDSPKPTGTKVEDATAKQEKHETYPPSVLGGEKK